MFCQNQLTPMPITRVLTLGEEEDIEDEGMCWEKAGVIETVLSACRGIHEVRLRNLYLPFAAELFSAKLSGALDGFGSSAASPLTLSDPSQPLLLSTSFA